jgi:hypothetical protein
MNSAALPYYRQLQLRCKSAGVFAKGKTSELEERLKSIETKTKLKPKKHKETPKSSSSSSTDQLVFKFS